MANINAISGFIKSSFVGGFEKPPNQQRKPVVAVSRGFGAQGQVVSKMLSEKLGVPHYDSQLIDKILKSAKSDKNFLELLDERVVHNMDDWIYSLFGKKINRGEYYRLLIKTVSMIGQSGGVILGRGAHLILSHDPSVFRLRVDGSLEACSRRISAKQNIDLKQAAKLVKKTDAERVHFIRELFNRFPTNRSYYDLMVCTDYLEPEQVVELALLAMEKRGHIEPEPSG